MKKNEAIVSIIIPVYNAKKYLANTLDSVIKQTYKNLEIILVNDGSTDNSKDICESYAKIDKRIKVINKENGGVSSARNYGLALAKGEYISFVDSDDFLVTDMIETLVNDIQNTNAEIAVCGYWHVTEEEYKKNRKTATNEEFMNLEVLVNPIKYYYSKKYMPNIWNKIFKKDLIKDIQFDDTIHYGEDFLFCALAFIKAKKATYRDSKKYFYIKREDGLSMSQGSLEFWNGYAKSKKMLYDKLLLIDANKNLLNGVWKEYCIAIMAIYRYVVHKRMPLEYYKISNLYRKIILKFLKTSDIKFLKKIEYFSFILSYRIAILCHRKK